MKQPRFRFSLRNLMLAVALAALLLEAAHLTRRSFDLSRKAAVFEQKAQLARSLVTATEFSIKRSGTGSAASTDATDLARMRAAAAYHGALGRKYRLAATRPWQTVPPDTAPPPPPSR